MRHSAKSAERHVMNILFSCGTIELTKAEMKDAQKYGSDMYNKLMAARHDNPGFKVVEAKVKKTKNPLDSLTIKTIKAYVKLNGNDDQKNMFLDLCEEKTFFEVKKWFLAEFPKFKDDLENRHEEMKKVFKAIDDKIADEKEKAAEAAREEERKRFLAAS